MGHVEELRRGDQLDVQAVGGGALEVHKPDAPVALLGLVVHLPLAAQPGEHLAVAFDGGRDRLEPLDDLAYGNLAHPGV